jgi:hypothetical protein
MFLIIAVLALRALRTYLIRPKLDFTTTEVWLFLAVLPALEQFILSWLIPMVLSPFLNDENVRLVALGLYMSFYTRTKPPNTPYFLSGLLLLLAVNVVCFDLPFWHSLGLRFADNLVISVYSLASNYLEKRKASALESNRQSWGGVRGGGNAPSPPRRVAFTGGAGHGKSTAVQYLLKKHGGKELMFAYALKRLVERLMGVKKYYLWDPKGKETPIAELGGVTGRELCQKIGTELFRIALNREIPNLKLLGPTIWIHQVATKIAQFASENLWVSDCRFQDEYQFLKSQGFTVIKIWNPRVLGHQSGHASESGCDYDQIVENSGTLEEFYEKLDILIS